MCFAMNKPSIIILLKMLSIYLSAKYTYYMYVETLLRVYL